MRAWRTGPKRSEYRIECERFPCSFCHATPGQSCSVPYRPVPATSGHKPHASRRRALEQAQLAAIRW